MKITNRPGVLSLVPQRAQLRLALTVLLWLAGTLSLPAALKTWGGSSNGNWSTAANWMENVAPVDGDDLVFPSAAANLLNTNNLAGLDLKSITFPGSGYAIRGNAISLTNGLSGQQAGGGNTVELAITLGAAQTFDCVTAGASQTLSGNITNAGFLLTVSGSGNTTLSGVISGTGGMTKNGAGTCQLSGSSVNTYSGTTAVNAGTLELNKASGVAIAGASLTIGDGVGGKDADVVRELAGDQIADSVPITLNSSGLLDLNGFNDTVGPLTFNGGDIATGAGSLYMGGNATVNANTNSVATVAGKVSLPGTRTIDVPVHWWSPDITVTATISGTGGLIKSGPGELHLSASNSFSGAVTVNGGTLQVGNDWALGSTNAGTTVNSNGILVVWFGKHVGQEPLTLNSSGGSTFGPLSALYGSNSWAGAITLDTNSTVFVYGTSDALNVSGVIGGTGTLTKTGLGTLIFSGSDANTYTNATYVNAGTLVLRKSVGISMWGPLVIGDGVGGANADVVRLEANAQLANTVAVTVNSSGLFDLNNLNAQLGSLAGSGNASLGNAEISPGFDNSSTVFSGVISGSGKFSKAGTGTMTLTGNNTYIGLTTVSNGTLIVNGFQPQSPVTVGSSGALGGSGTVGSIVANGRALPGASPGILTCSNVAFSATGDFSVELNGSSAGTGYDQLSVRGTVNLTNPALHATLGFPSALSNSFTIIDNDGSDAVSGTFAGLPEGATVNVGGTPFRISYTGGTGNDVVLTQLTATQRPLLNVAPASGTNVLLWWPTNFIGYALEANTNLGTNVWSAVSNTPVLLGTNNFVTNAASGNQKYYRLHNP